MLSKQEQLILTELHDDIDYIDLPDDLSQMMKDLGSYKINPELFLYTYTNLCGCGTLFNEMDYENECPICKNKKFKIQNINEKELVQSISNNSNNFSVKRTKFGNKMIFEKKSDNITSVYVSKQFFTFNWLTKELILDEEENKDLYGELVFENDNLYFVNKKKEIVNIFRFISLINHSSLSSFIDVYNEYFPKKPLPKLSVIKKIELKKMIYSHGIRITTEYFKEYQLFYPENPYGFYKKFQEIEKKMKNNKEMPFIENEKNENIYKTLRLPKSVLKHIHNYFIQFSNESSLAKKKDFSLYTKKDILNKMGDIIKEHNLEADKAIKLFDLFIVSQKRNAYTFYLNDITQKIHVLINEENHKFKDLIRYIEFELQQNQKLSLIEGLRIYYDYVNMSRLMNIPYDKYSKNVEKVHDIRVKDFNIVKDKQSEKLFIDIYSRKKLKEDKFDDFIFLAPKNTRDLVEEGQLLHHCVASYTDKVIEGNSLIFFMRNKNNPKKRLVTIEVYKDGRIIQSRGSYNRKVTIEEKKAIHSWAKANNFSVVSSL